MVKSRKMRGGTCNAMPNVSVYNSPCSGLPLDSQFQQQFSQEMNNNLQSGGGYFLDIGNPNPINPMDASVQGYSECCHPLFNTSVGSTNAVNAANSTAGANSGVFNASGYAVGANGNALCGGGRKNANTGKRKRGKDKAKNSKSRGYTGKQTRRLKEQINTQLQKKGSKKGKKGKGSKKGKKMKGGQNSNFSGNMMNRSFNCAQPNWNASCI